MTGAKTPAPAPFSLQAGDSIDVILEYRTGGLGNQTSFVLVLHCRPRGGEARRLGLGRRAAPWTARDGILLPRGRRSSRAQHARVLWTWCEDGRAWCGAARRLAAEAGIPLDAARIGHLDGDLFDPRCTWLRHRQIAADGAVLVRPDRFIAWRSLAGASDPEAALADALSQVLAGTPAASAV